jgi:exopolysaccharide biosynthesis polyprenyl glycosylphosphotransferase
VIRLEDARSPRLSGAESRTRAADRDQAARYREAQRAHDSRGYGWLRWLLIAIDFAGALAAWGVVLFAGGPDTWTVRLSRSAPLALSLALATVAINGVQRLYLARVCAVRSVETGRLARTCLVCGVAAAWIGGVLRDRPTPAEAVVGALGSFTILAALRGVYAAWLRGCRARDRFVRKVCVLGTNNEAAALVELLESQPELGYRVVGVIGERDEWQPTHLGVPVVAIGPDVVESVHATGASGVLVAVSAVAAGHLDRVVRDLMAGAIHVQISSGLARVGHQRLRFAPLSHQLMFYVEPHELKRWQAALKRTMDAVVGSIVLVCAAPVLVAAAVAIKFHDRGPVLYRQERVGRDGRRFDVLKLRTMVPDASAQLKLLEAQNERSGPLFKLSSDPRVTPVGRFLRATSIDELPQLVNVVRGDMSLVGPRPALPSEVEQFDYELQERISVPPGLTGLWQVEARDNPSFHAYRRLDLFYVDNWSLTMDLAIIAGTVLVVVGRAARAFRKGTELAQPVVRQPDVVAPAMALVEPSGASTSSLPA